MRDGVAGTRHEMPSEWIGGLASIVGGPDRRVIVLGQRDVGKSTFCRALLSDAQKAGRRACLVDADLGQKMVGPPACVTVGQPKPGRVIRLTDLVFVGAIDPVQGWQDLISGLIRMVAAADAGVLIVNTSGLLAGPGPRLKAQKIAAINPDLVVGIGDGPDLETVLSDHSDRAVMRLPSSPRARRKTAGERQAARREAFRAYFAHSFLVSVAYDDLTRLGGSDGREEVLPGLLAAFSGQAGRDLGLGVVAGIDAEARRFSCITPIQLDRAVSMRWGRCRLDRSFSESFPLDGQTGPPTPPR
jgi:polynucleotide 5'-hydroxyl-kinase GRC3/NOL9